MDRVVVENAYEGDFNFCLIDVAVYMKKVKVWPSWGDKGDYDVCVCLVCEWFVTLLGLLVFWGQKAN